MNAKAFKQEAALNARYALAGIMNTIVGLVSIWALLRSGVSPILANLLGYLLGLTVSFVASKKFVFRTRGRVTKEGVSFVIAFLISYSFNLLVLYVCYAWAGLEVMLAQVIAMLSYIVCMYLLQRFVVFYTDTK